MSAPWPRVKLGEVLRQDEEYIEEPEARLYKKLSVKLYGKGVVLDPPADGSLLKMKRHQIAKTGQVILSEIWGKKGAVGLVPEDGDGALCTSHFFLFDINKERLSRGWLQAIFTANYLEEQLGAEAKGTTGYAAVRPKTLLECEIPLPPMAEQRRIVAWIEELAAKIAEARSLRQEAAGEAETLTRASVERGYRDFGARAGYSRLMDVCKTITDGDHVTPQFSPEGACFIFVGNVSTGHLHFRGSKRVSEEYFKALRPQRVPKRGDVLYSAVGATLGVPAIVNTDEPFCFQRHIAILKPDHHKIDSGFLWHMLRSRTIFDRAWSSTTGTAQPTVALRAIRELPIPLPSLAEQREAVAYFDALQTKLGALQQLQVETATELDALLPSILDKAFKGDL